MKKLLQRRNRSRTKMGLLGTQVSNGKSSITRSLTGSIRQQRRTQKSAETCWGDKVDTSRENRSIDEISMSFNENWESELGMRWMQKKRMRRSFNICKRRWMWTLRVFRRRSRSSRQIRKKASPDSSWLFSRRWRSRSRRRPLSKELRLLTSKEGRMNSTII